MEFHPNPYWEIGLSKHAETQNMQMLKTVIYL